MTRQPMPTLAGPEALQPQARPVDTFAAPGKSVGGVTDLMQSLAAFSPALSQYADKLHAEHVAGQEAAAQRKIGGMTFEESQAAVEDGTLPEFASPWFRAAFEKQHGLRLANDVRRKAEEHLATADMSQEDPTAFTAQLVREAQATLPPGKFAESGFNEGTANLLGLVADKVNADRIARTVEARADNALQNFTGDITQLVEMGRPPKDVLTAVRQRYGMNRDLLGISYREQDKIMGEVLKTLAQRPGMESVVSELGKLDRDGISLATKLGANFETLKTGARTTTEADRKDRLQADIERFTTAANSGTLPDDFEEFAKKNLDVLGGSWVAAMRERAANAAQAALAHAVSQAQSVAKETYLTSVTPQLADLARQGRVAEVSDLTAQIAGKTVNVPQKEARDLALSTAATQIATEMTAQKRDPVDIRQAQIEMYGANGQVDPRTESLVSALLHGSVSGSDLPPSVMNYLPELQAAYRAAPHMVEQIATTSRDKRFIESIFVGMDTGLDQATAVREAIWRRDNFDKIALPQGKVLKGITDKVSKEIGSERFPGLMDRVIIDRVEYYASVGASGKDLERRVSDSILRSHAQVNGHFVDVTGTGMTGPQALPVFADVTDALLEARPELKGQKITFIPTRAGSDRFRAVNSTGQPIAGTERTWDEMRDLYGKRRAARLQSRAGRARDYQPSSVGNPGVFAPTNLIF